MTRATRGPRQRPVVSFEPLVRRRRLVVACFLGLTAAAAPGLALLQIDNSPEGFFPQEHDALQTLQSMEHAFGRDNGLRIVLEGGGLWTAEGLRWLAELESSLAPPENNVRGVYAVAGPMRHHRWHLRDWPPADPDAFRELLLMDPVDRNAAWIGPEGKWVSVLVGLFNLPPGWRETTLAALEARLPVHGDTVGSAAPAATVPHDISAELVGLPVVSRALDRGQAHIARVLFPGLVAVAVLLLVILFQDVAGVVLPLTLVGVTQIVLLGFAGYAGQRIDFVTSLLLPLVFVITLATAVHVLAYCRRFTAADTTPEQAIERTYRVKAWPVVWTGATTCIGFGSLAVSPVPSVRALGLWAAFGIAFGTLAALSLYPALLAMSFARTSARSQTRIDAWIGGRCRAVVRLGIRSPGHVTVAFGLVAVVALLGLPRLTVDTGALAYFAPQHPLRRQIERMERAALPPVSASLLLELPGEGPGFDRPESLRRLAALASELRTEPLVWGALSAGDLVMDVARRLVPSEGPRARLSVSSLAAARARMNTVPDLDRLLTAVLTRDGRRARIVLFTPMRSDEALGPAYERVEVAARRAFPDARVALTGQYPLVLSVQRSLLSTMILSLSLTLIAIAGIFCVLLRSPGLTLRVLGPNVWPVLLTLGTMCWFGIPLDSPTVMIAAVVLGLAVDDTFHSLGHLRRHLQAPHGDTSRERLLEACFAEVTTGHVATTAILFAGFLVPTLSDLLPVARFGALCALAIAAALAADVLLVPALLATAPGRQLAPMAASRVRREPS